MSIGHSWMGITIQMYRTNPFYQNLLKFIILVFLWKRLGLTQVQLVNHGCQKVCYIKWKIDYTKNLSNPTLEREMTHRRYKNKLNHSIRIAKSLYYSKKLECVKLNTKATWWVLNEIINKKKSKTKFASSFKASDSREIANRFCNYFTNISPNLAKKNSNFSKFSQIFFYLEIIQIQFFLG